VSLGRQIVFYYAALGIVVVSYLALRRITRSQFGEVLLAIRENEVRVRFAGYHVEQYKTVAMALSATFAGLAGALTAIHERIASPENLSWPLSGDAVLYATLGGTGTLLGAFFGAGIVILAREVLSDLVRSWLIFVGATYIVLVFFLPDGLYPLLLRPRRRR
jgi:ABC-type branched-subunit amino acid transport system permease subunit